MCCLGCHTAQGAPGCACSAFAGQLKMLLMCAAHCTTILLVHSRKVAVRLTLTRGMFKL